MKIFLQLLFTFIVISFVGQGVAQEIKMPASQIISLDVGNNALFSTNKEITKSGKQLEESVLFWEDFEESTYLFTTIDANGDGTAWSIYSEFDSGLDAAYEGDGSAGAYSGYRENDDYLVSNDPIVLPAEKQITLSFYARSRSGDYLENFNLKLSTTDKAVESFSEVLDEVRDKSDEWEMMEYDLSEYAGQTVYLAFHSISNDEWELYIDNVKVTASESAGTVQAAFSAAKPYGQAPVAIQFTDNSIGDVTSWQWNFGDGTTSTQQNPSHTYSAPGYYDVTLQVSNGSSTSSKTIYKMVTIIDDYSQYTWENCNISDNNGSYLETYFIDENNGFVFQYDQAKNLLKTSDGGKTWTKITMPEETFMYEIEFADNQTGYIRTTTNYMFKTVDGGNNWTKINLPEMYYYHEALDMEVVSANTVLFVLDNFDKDVIRTTDGGANWVLLDFADYVPKYVSFVNDTMAYIACQGYDESIQLFKTIDGGDFWTQVGTVGNGDQNVKGIHFYSEDIGFIYGAGFRGDDMVSSIWKTIDGGASTSVSEKSGFEISDLCCLTPDYVFYSGEAHLATNKPEVFSLNYENPENVLSWTFGEVHSLCFVSPTLAYSAGEKNTFKLKKIVTSAESMQENSALKVYPNPASELLTIQHNLNGPVTVQVINSNGQTMKILNDFMREQKSIDISDYVPGLYFIKVTSEKITNIQKVIIH